MRPQIPQLAPRSDALVEFLRRVLGGLALAGELPRSGLLNDKQNPPTHFIQLVVRPHSADHSARMHKRTCRAYVRPRRSHTTACREMVQPELSISGP